MPDRRATRRRGIVYVVAAALFLTVGTVAFLSLPSAPDDLRPLPFLVVAFVLAPANTICNAAEYAATARYAGIRVGARDALTIAVLSTAANLLPLPGAALVRGAALRREGTSTVHAGRLVVAASGVWLSCTVFVGGVVIAAGGDPLPGAALVAAAGVGVAVAHRLAGQRGQPDGGRVTAALVGIESATVGIGALRLWLCIRGLGFDASAAQSVLLAMASVLASAAGIFPGGLGLREALAAWLAPFASLASAVGAAASTTDRLLGLPVLGGAFVIVWGSPRRRAETRRRLGDVPELADP